MRFGRLALSSNRVHILTLQCQLHAVVVFHVCTVLFERRVVVNRQRRLFDPAGQDNVCVSRDRCLASEKRSSGKSWGWAWWNGRRSRHWPTTWPRAVPVIFTPICCYRRTMRKYFDC